MRLSNLNLSAFYACAQELNVSAAAQKLGVTQSALSQRLSALESELELTLFIRDPKGLILTEEGMKFLRYAEQIKNAEDEILLDLKGEKLGGTIRIAGFSSVMRSKVMPALTPFLRKHPELMVDFQTYEVFELPKILETSRADFILLDYALERKNIKAQKLFEEEYVVIESSKYQSPSDIYLDHAAHDTATEEFFHSQKLSPNYKRMFMGDIYGIIQGVEEGLGRAVMCKHLIEDNKKIRIVKGLKKFNKPVTLHYYERAYFPKLHEMILKVLSESF